MCLCKYICVFKCEYTIMYEYVNGILTQFTKWTLHFSQRILKISLSMSS